VRSLCRALGIPLKVLRLRKQGGPGSSLQDWARDLRYGFFARMVRKCRAWGCATAHHQDDQAETVLDRMIRGSGLRGLSAMRPVSTASAQGSLKVWRPLLGFSKKELEAYLKKRGTTWRVDASNSKADYKRNRLRRDLMPRLRRFNPQVDEALSRLAETVWAEDELLESLTRRAAARTTRAKTKRVVEVDAARFEREPLAIRRRLVRLWAEGLNSHARGLKLGRIEEIRLVWEGVLPGPLDMGFGLKVQRRDKRALLLFKKAHPGGR
jgi:tRNA(Ile)-lysidine synthase